MLTSEYLGRHPRVPERHSGHSDSLYSDTNHLQTQIRDEEEGWGACHLYDWIHVRPTYRGSSDKKLTSA